MKVGISAEVKRNEWVKLDLEEADLLSLLVDAGLPPEIRSKVNPVLAYQILDNELHRLFLAKLAMDYGADNFAPRLEELTTKRKGLFAQLQAIDTQSN